MKKLSKIVALLLAGALTMLLFTACSGGGGGGDYGTRDAGKEASLFTSVKDSRQASAQVTANDPTLCETADRHLKEDLNSSVDFLGAKWVANVHVDGKCSCGRQRRSISDYYRNGNLHRWSAVGAYAEKN